MKEREKEREKMIQTHLFFFIERRARIRKETERVEEESRGHMLCIYVFKRRKEIQIRPSA
jgi:hypothetical protein